MYYAELVLHSADIYFSLNNAQNILGIFSDMLYVCLFHGGGQDYFKKIELGYNNYYQYLVKK